MAAENTNESRSEISLQPILDALPNPLPTTRRFVIAIAGSPASGKSTIASQLCGALAPRAAILGMDAFHYDNQILESRGDLSRKGAPHTFDVDGYAAMLARLRSEPEQSIAVPEFDRNLELTRNAAHIASPDHSIIVTEGNYLLLDHDPWPELAPLFDLTVWLDVAISTIEERLMQRWLDQGFTAHEAAKRLADNDLPNAELVQANSRAGDIMLTI